jgi:hypothetical protein
LLSDKAKKRRSSSIPFTARLNSEQLEAQLEKEEQEVPYYVAWPDVPTLEWIAPEKPIEAYASVSIDGVKILTRDEGHREVKIVSVSEVILKPEPDERPPEPKIQPPKDREFDR